MSEQEDRKTTLIKAAIEFIENTCDFGDTVFYDDADCDGYCLIEDIRNEFLLEEN